MKSIETNERLELIPDRGLIHHPLFGEVIVWRQHEFHTWWNRFEPMFQRPMSRTFVNAFVDFLELREAFLPARGFFRKGKNQKAMERIYSALGWGRVELKTNRVVQSGHSLLCVALGQYILETYTQQRYKIRWLEPRPQTVQLELEESDNLPPPKPHEAFPWSSSSVNVKSSSMMTLEQHHGCELRMEGERVLLIPVKALERFLRSCLPYLQTSKREWFSHENESLSPFANLLQTVIESTSAMFLGSEQPVYITDQTSWDAYFDHYLAVRGWGTVEILEYDTSTLELTCCIQHGPSLPFTLGIIGGIWERAHGRAYRMQLQPKNETFLVKIESFLEYQNG